jgi:hypothetical protein
MLHLHCTILGSSTDGPNNGRLAGFNVSECKGPTLKDKHKGKIHSILLITSDILLRKEALHQLLVDFKLGHDSV